MAGKFTHYTYLRLPDGRREPTGLMDLSNRKVHDRRRMIHHFMRQGELVAHCSWFGITVNDMKDLRGALNWLAAKKKSGAEPDSGR